MRSRRTTGALALVACLLGLLLAGPAHAQGAAGLHQHALGKHHARAHLLATVASSPDAHRLPASPDAAVPTDPTVPQLVAGSAAGVDSLGVQSRHSITALGRGPPDA